MLRFPNCKINIGLSVTRKREDGYHDIETVFYPLTGHNTPLRDVLEVVPAATTQLHMSGLAVAGSNEDNLVWRAYQLLKADFDDKVLPLDIYLHKVLPMGAGLGGGSADGAFLLKLLNDYCALGLSDEQLIGYALQLGSDCPFFILNTPQYATGRGEVMTGIALDLSGYSIQLICPGLHVATGKAFGMLTPAPAKFDLRQLATLPITEWKEHVVNDFEGPVFAQHPVLSNIKQQLYDQGALYASMSGSGSAIFGIFNKGMRATIQTSIPFGGFNID